MGSRVPDLQNRMLQGSTSPGSYLSAGLPNITGEIGSNAPHISQQFLSEIGYYSNGAFFSTLFQTTWGTADYKSWSGINPYNVKFDASRVSYIYGNSSTVQPPAYTTRFLIRAKS